MARDICKIIDFLIAEVIPHTEYHVISGMKHIQKKAVYTPSEGEYEGWCELGMLFSVQLGQPKEDDDEWKKRVGRVMRDEEKVPDSQLPEPKDSNESQ